VEKKESGESWKVVLTRPADKAYDKASQDMQDRLDTCFEELEKNPLNGANIKQLTGKLKGFSRYRIGDWRVIFRIVTERRVVEIIAILPRGSAYKK